MESANKVWGKMRKKEIEKKINESYKKHFRLTNQIQNEVLLLLFLEHCEQLLV